MNHRRPIPHSLEIVPPFLRGDVKEKERFLPLVEMTNKERDICASRWRRASSLARNYRLKTGFPIQALGNDRRVGISSSLKIVGNDIQINRKSRGKSLPSPVREGSWHESLNL